MAHTKHEISVHVRLSDEANAALELLCEASQVDKAKHAGFLLERVLLGEGHALKVAAMRYARLGITGTTRES
jgi:hypothetical protein